MHTTQDLNHDNQHWSPASRCLVDEMPDLIARLRSDGFVVRRVMFNLTDWDDTPRRAEIDGRLIRFGGFTTQRHNMITLIDDSGRFRRNVLNDSV